MKHSITYYNKIASQYNCVFHDHMIATHNGEHYTIERNCVLRGLDNNDISVDLVDYLVSEGFNIEYILAINDDEGKDTGRTRIFFK